MKHITLVLLFNLSLTLIKAQNFGWATHFQGTPSSTGYNSIYKITTDAQGNVYSTGINVGGTDFNPNNPSLDTAIFSVLVSDIFVTKHDVNGNFVWSRNMGSYANTDNGNDIAVDYDGNVYTTGSFGGPLTDFDPGPDTAYLPWASSIDMYVSKLDPDGNYVWAKSFAVEDIDLGTAITIDPFQNIYAAGVRNGLFISKLSSDGDSIWSKTIDAQGEILSIITDHSGSIYATGRYEDTVDFNPDSGINNHTAVGIYDAFIVKFDSSGLFQWSKSIGGPGINKGLSIALDPLGNITLSGTFTSNADFDPGVNTAILESNGTNDMFVAKYDHNGHYLWAKSFAGGTHSGNLTSDSIGNMYITGGFHDIAFEGGDCLITKMSPSGEFIWTRSLVGNMGALSIQIDPFNNVYVAGGFNDTIDFNPNTGEYFLTPFPADMGNAFILQLTQDICSNLTLVFDSMANVSCSNNQGYAFVHAKNGAPPYTYAWNSTPPILDSAIQFSSGGIYELTVTDAEGCIATRSVLVGERPPLGILDVQVNVMPGGFRPGVTGNIFIDAMNDGCIPSSGELKLILDSLLVFNSSTPPHTALNGDTIIWVYDDITYDTPNFTALVEYTTSLSANIGDSVSIVAMITPMQDDIDSSDNIRNYIFPVINSYDPNDKSVYPKGECEQGFIRNNQLLTYTIRFQNTGNAEAINIHVMDSLSDYLDMNSVRVVGNSHRMFTEILPNNTLNFVFDNIFLPDSNSNEPASHGYIIFEVMPLTNLPEGVEIENGVGIYFDFNPPVITNTVLNTISGNEAICNDGAGVYDKPSHLNILAYPNPAHGLLNIRIDKSPNLNSIKCFDISGKKIFEMKNIHAEIYTMDVSTLSPGIYFIEVSQGTMSYKTKFVKQ